MEGFEQLLQGLDRATRRTRYQYVGTHSMGIRAHGVQNLADKVSWEYAYEQTTCIGVIATSPSVSYHAPSCLVHLTRGCIRLPFDSDGLDLEPRGNHVRHILD